MTINFDWITASVIGALIATLAAFFTGLFPYPSGWLVVTALLLFRLPVLLQKE